MKCKADQSMMVQALNSIKEKHGLTQEEWVKKSGVPKSTLVRYLNSSLNMPNFPYVCAMLKCVGESIDAFYDCIDKKIDTPAEAMKLEQIPTGIVNDVPVDTPEYLQAQLALVKEKEAMIELLEARLEMTERIIEEKDRTIANIEDISKRRLQAIQALCMAQ